MARRRAWIITLAVLTLVVATDGCGGDGGGAIRPSATTTRSRPTLTTTTAVTPAEPAVQTQTFVDSSRQRTLPTDIYLPPGPGPFPLIVHAHGYGGSKAKFSQLLTGWARAGFVVVAPNFPRTNDGAADKTPADIANQPADVSFVLSQVLALATVGPRIDPSRIGLSGLSLGGGTAEAVLFNTCCRDRRFVAGLLMSSTPAATFAGGTWDFAAGLPTLVFAGTADEAIPYDKQVTNFGGLAGPKWLVTLEGGHHASPYEDAPDPHDPVVQHVTLDFWQATLGHDAAAQRRLADDATSPGLAHVESTP